MLISHDNDGQLPASAVSQLSPSGLAMTQEMQSLYERVVWNGGVGANQKQLQSLTCVSHSSWSRFISQNAVENRIATAETLNQLFQHIPSITAEDRGRILNLRNLCLWEKQHFAVGNGTACNKNPPTAEGSRLMSESGGESSPESQEWGQIPDDYLLAELEIRKQQFLKGNIPEPRRIAGAIYDQSLPVAGKQYVTCSAGIARSRYDRSDSDIQASRTVLQAVLMIAKANHFPELVAEAEFGLLITDELAGFDPLILFRRSDVLAKRMQDLKRHGTDAQRQARSGMLCKLHYDRMRFSIEEFVKASMMKDESRIVDAKRRLEKEMGRHIRALEGVTDALHRRRAYEVMARAYLFLKSLGAAREYMTLAQAELPATCYPSDLSMEARFEAFFSLAEGKLRDAERHMDRAMDSAVASVLKMRQAKTTAARGRIAFIYADLYGHRSRSMAA